MTPFRTLTRRSPTIMVSALFFVGFLLTAEAVVLRTYSATVGPTPGILCGCTDTLKNFA